MRIRHRQTPRGVDRRSWGERVRLVVVDISINSPNALCTFRPNLGGVRPVARILAVIATLCAVVLTGAACSSSSGTHTQSLSPSPTDSGSLPPSKSTGPSSPPSSSGVATPTVTPPAQDAVDAYIAFYNASTAADRDPAHADLAALNRYLSGKALNLFDGIYASMRKAGLAYRGSPPNPRVKVSSVLGSTAVFLSSCPLASSSDPYVEYHVATGKPVATGTPRTPPPPYLLTLPMKKVAGHWKLTDVLQDTSKTCRG
jgi:hypothetical protein